MMAINCTSLYSLAVLNPPFSIVLRILQLFCSDEDVDSFDNVPNLPSYEAYCNTSTVLTVVIMAAPL